MTSKDPLFFEKILIKFLYTNEKVRDRVMPYLNVEIFDDKNNIELMKHIFSFDNKYERFPTIKESRIDIKSKEVHDHLMKITQMDTSEYDNEFLLDEIEGFLKKKIIWNLSLDIAENINNDTMDEIGEIPDKLREAHSFSFDTSIGLNISNEEDRLYDFFHEKKHIVPTGLKDFDNLINGGYHAKSLTLFLAGCVDENTKVKIRYKKRYMEKWIEKEVSIKEIKKLLLHHDVEITSLDGWVPVTNYVEKGRLNGYELHIDNKIIISSWNHLYETNIGWIYAKDLDSNKHVILCEDGKYKHFQIKKSNKKYNIVDVTINHPNHRYYTNGVSSHNTNVGKSLVMASSAVSNVLMNKKVLYVSCELSEEMTAQRILANIFDVPMDDLKLLSRDKFHEKYEKISKGFKDKFIIKEYPSKSINANAIRNLLKDLKTKMKFEPDIIYIDQIENMNPIHRSRGDNTYTEMKKVSNEVRALGSEYGVPMVSGIQTDRKGLTSTELDLDNTGESIGFVQIADVVVAMTQSDELRSVGKYCWQLLKNRYGLNRRKITVCVNYEKMRISDDPDNISDTIGTPPPPTEKEEQEKEKNAITDIKGILKKNKKIRDNKVIEFE
ncbi:MAG: DnaB-like helicase C-terminal domain-containing protein [Candidatus Pacearchaeota archaeon]